MAKLNKQEINAIASKTLRMINESIEKSRDEQIKNYVPSNNYQIIKECLEKIKNYNLVIEEITENLRNEFKTFRETFKLYDIPEWSLKEIKNESRIESILHKFINGEIKLKELPTLEEIKEEITIGAIDENCDVNEVINSLVNKYN